MNQTKVESGIPFAISRKLHLVRQRKAWLHIASALVTALAVLLAAMGLAMLIDWLATLYDSRWRVVLTSAAILAAVATAVGWLIVARQRFLVLNQIAGDVDRQIPQLEERWTTLTRLGDDATNTKIVHPAMLRRVSSEAVSFEPHVEPEQVVPVSVLMRSMVALTAVTAVLGFAVVMNTHQTFVLMQRFWLPSSLISATELVDIPGDVVIGRGEPLELTAAVNGTPVDRATLFMQAADDSSKSINMVAHGTDPIAFSHRLRAVEQPFEYRFRAGDGQSEWYSVAVADRPEIAELSLVVTPPAYTRQDTKNFNKLPLRVSTIEKSTLELAIRPKAVVESVTLQLGGNNEVKLTADSDGWYRWKTTLKDGFDFSPILTESHGLTNRRPPKCSVSVYPDRPPAVKVITPDDQMAVRPDDTIHVTFSASDDVGIGSAELLIYDESPAGSKTEPIASIPIDLGDQQGAKIVQQSVPLDLGKFAAQDGAEISYEIRVREDRGGSTQAAANQNPANAANMTNASSTNPTTASQTAATQASPTAESQPSQVAASQSSQAAAPEASQTATSQREGATPDQNQTAQSGSQPSENKLAQSSPPQANPPAGYELKQPAQENNSGEKSDVAKTDPPAAQQGAAAGSKSPNDPAAATEQAQTKVAGATPPADGPASPAKDARANSASPSPPPNAIAANMPNNAASQASGAKSQPQGSQPQQGSPSPSNSSPSSQNQSAKNSANAQQSPGGQPNAAAGKQQPPSAADANKMAAEKSKKTDDPASPREATSGRQGLSTNQMADADKQDDMKSQLEKPEASPSQPGQSAKDGSDSEKMAKDTPSSASEPKPNSANSAAPPKDGSQQANQSKSNQDQSSPSSSQSASSRNSNSKSDPKSPSDSQQSNDNMPKRMLDVGEPASNSSKRMRLKIDELAGSFSGQQRAKLEMAIAPELEALDKALAKGQSNARGVLDQLETDANWRTTHDRDVSAAEKSALEALDVIGKLQKRAKDTPYAFIGLQVADIGMAHVDPARADFWKALQSEGEERPKSVHDGWQHLGRARELVAELRGQFERARRDFQLAESVEKFKKMYQVFIENTQAMLPTQSQDPDFYNRKGVEFKLDEEYLARLKEVLEMRRDLQAELARILADDPRLLRRFMDSVRNRTNNLRAELADLVAEQEDLSREVRAWSLVEEKDRPKMGRLLMLRQVQDATNLARDAGEMQSRYQAWAPLGPDAKDPEVIATTKLVQDVATAAGELGESAQAFVVESQRVAAAAPAGDAANATQPGDAAAAQPAADAAQPAQPSLEPLLVDGQKLYDQLTGLETSLRQLAAREDVGEASQFAGNRLVDAQRLIADTSAWVRQMRAHHEGNYAGAAEVDQYRLAMKTDAFATKLGSLEQSLAGSLQRQDGTLPEPIANKSRELLATLDKEAAPNQLAAVYALHSNQMPRATERQKSAGAALTKAEKLYDELMKLTIAELDKLPVQDPIADLLNDPTLDELLAQLEQELPIEELLGIPSRPSNLRIIGDWLRPNDRGNNGGSGARMASNQMRQDQQRMRRRLDQAYQRAVARALKEESKRRKIEMPKATMSDWNKLVSELGDDLRQGRDKAPPEQYRRAIEQYFEEISRAVAAQDRQSP
jgi:hypothetical protein